VLYILKPLSSLQVSHLPASLAIMASNGWPSTGGSVAIEEENKKKKNAFLESI